MAQPTSYDRQYSFRAFQTANPDDPLPGQQVDIELNAVKFTLDEILTNLALLQRDDGELANNSVGTEQLDGLLISLGFERPTSWLTATVYAAEAAVFQSNKLYICLVAHTSGTFATDLAAAKWVEVVDFNTLVTDAVAARDLAQTYAADALGSKNSAQGYAATASAAATAADASADAISAGVHEWYGSASGTDNYTVPAIAGFTPAVRPDGLRVRMRIVNANTGPATLLVGAYAVADVRRYDNTVLVSGDWPAGATVTCDWDESSGIYRWQGDAPISRFVTTGTANIFTALQTFNAAADFNALATFNFAAVFNKQVRFGDTQLTDAAAIEWDMSLSPNAVVIVAGNRNLSDPINETIGDHGQLRIVQDAVGGRTITWGSSYKFTGDNDARPDPTASATTLYDYWVRGANDVVMTRKYMSASDGIGFFKEYTADNPFALSTTQTVAHGLGRHPSLIVAYLECKTAELGWAVGDRILVPLGDRSDGASMITVGHGTVNFYTVTPAALPGIVNKSTNARTSITAANWKLMVRVYE